ncbi:aspartate dehydrogenase [Paracoccus stylophorae]|uniref:L-aspartate dehydrogenase n=1 Tax=Paracoccus stylophorae TaxID=659350 RepID=A0ABY7SYP5_9RHOB|nr:aspartate dehydrogenase [Paracoccus stylophorae]WCR12071.1 aspartate dehydrogenase [Paracoccus stylophorae]
MKIGLIGHGAIAGYVSAQLGSRGIRPAVFLMRTRRALDGQDADAMQVTEARDLPEGLDLMVDCAGHAGLAAHGPAILAAGIDLVSVSLGALADRDLHDRLEDAAQQGGARLHLASGAIGALDCLQAARIGGLDEVTYIGRKPPAGWKGSPAETALDLDGLTKAAEHFAGDARRAATEYPKNANVAAAVALAGTGFDATQVRLIADPGISANIHEIHASGAFGRFSFRIEGTPLPDSPRSSALAAMSVVAAIERQRATIVI